MPRLAETDRMSLPSKSLFASWTSGAVSDLCLSSNGQNFIYNSSFGGTWCSIPFNDSAQVRSDVPALSSQWDWSNDLINGVNLGGWFVIEPFITPRFFEDYANVRP